MSLTRGQWEQGEEEWKKNVSRGLGTWGVIWDNECSLEKGREVEERRKQRKRREWREWRMKMKSERGKMESKRSKKRNRKRKERRKERMKRKR